MCSLGVCTARRTVPFASCVCRRIRKKTDSVDRLEFVSPFRAETRSDLICTSNTSKLADVQCTLFSIMPECPGKRYEYLRTWGEELCLQLISASHSSSCCGIDTSFNLKGQAPSNRKAYLESQVAQIKRPLYLQVAHNSLKSPHSYGPLAVQVELCDGAAQTTPSVGSRGLQCIHASFTFGLSFLAADPELPKVLNKQYALNLNHIGIPNMIEVYFLIQDVWKIKVHGTNQRIK